MKVKGSIVRRSAAMSSVLAAIAFAAGAGAQTASSIPDFSSGGAAWQTGNGGDFIPVPGSPPLVTNDPAHPYVSNAIANRTGKQPTYRISDLTNPNVKQWAKEVMKKDNDEVLKGKIAYTPGSSCKPWGIPALMLSGGPFYFVQTPKQVMMIESGDRLTRHIYMNVAHSANPKPSWYGESIGHYEGDTLVVDTIGLNDKTFVDNYRTPHTTQLHVVERFTLGDGGKTLEAAITVDDPGAFTMPWSAVQRWRRRDGRAVVEVVCAENSAAYFHYDVKPIPAADRPDF